MKTINANLSGSVMCVWKSRRNNQKNQKTKGSLEDYYKMGVKYPLGVEDKESQPSYGHSMYLCHCLLTQEKYYFQAPVIITKKVIKEE